MLTSNRSKAAADIYYTAERGPPFISPPGQATPQTAHTPHARTSGGVTHRRAGDQRPSALPTADDGRGPHSHREDWGLSWNMPLNGGSLLVSTGIRIEIELEAVLRP
jgi:hypothetical protein